MLKLSDVTPEGAKLSKKNFILINILSDIENKKKTDALRELLERNNDEKEMTWGRQFIKACECTPTKKDNGEVDDITYGEGFLHFVTIGWKIFYAVIPPPHMGGGWPCFFMSLIMIGITTYIVGEIANLFGCVLGIAPSVTAITFVALGTSLPDTFASMASAVGEKYADDAVGNVTGSNSVNVFLGLGLPWVIASLWERSVPESKKGYDSKGLYYVPGGSLGFSVIVFCICAVICIILLLVRRKVVGGELGGGNAGRTFSCVFLCGLWAIYVVMSILQTTGAFGKPKEGESFFGIKGMTSDDWDMTASCMPKKN